MSTSNDKVTTRCKLAMHAVAACVVATGGLITWLSFSLYQRVKATLHSYHVDGLANMIVLAMAIAVVATPFFAAALAQARADRPTNVKQAFQLYGAVIAILFTALTVVFTLLWLLGFLMSFLR